MPVDTVGSVDGFAGHTAPHVDCERFHKHFVESSQECRWPHDPMPSHTAPAESTDGSQTELTRSLNRSAGSFELVFAPVIMALVGLWIDRTFGTTPMFTVGLAVFGAIGAGVTQYFSYQRQLKVLAEQGAIVVDRPAAQYHAANRSEPRPIEVPEEQR